MRRWVVSLRLEALVDLAEDYWVLGVSSKLELR